LSTAHEVLLASGICHQPFQAATASLRLLATLYEQKRNLLMTLRTFPPTTQQASNHAMKNLLLQDGKMAANNTLYGP
jgi:hypothetical protein